MRYLFILLIFSAGFWACQPEEACISSATNRVVVGFYLDTLSKNLPVRIGDTLDLSQVYSSTATKPFFITNTETGPLAASSFVIRLDPDKDSTVLLFEGSRKKIPFSHRLVLNYKRRYRLISPDCPLEVSFQELQLKRTTFDTVIVINTEPREPSDDIDVQIIHRKQ